MSFQSHPSSVTGIQVPYSAPNLDLLSTLTNPHLLFAALNQYTKIDGPKISELSNGHQGSHYAINITVHTRNNSSEGASLGRRPRVNRISVIAAEASSSKNQVCYPSQFQSSPLASLLLCGITAIGSLDLRRVMSNIPLVRVISPHKRYISEIPEPTTRNRKICKSTEDPVRSHA